jgi:serine/threonine protein kinase/tetratricopeptide (TPR) repeat protein
MKSQPDAAGSRSSAQGAQSDRDLIDAALRSARTFRSGVSGSAACDGVLPTAFRIPGYDLVRRLRAGGQGVVFQAVQRSTGRTVALKLLREGILAGPAERARLEREVAILATLEHPAIVSVVDSGACPDGQLYYAMDFVRGEPLDAFVRHAELGTSDTLKLLLSVCEAVNAAHQRGVIHRDLKPGNILVDEEGNPHVLDFGLAKQPGVPPEHEVVTHTGEFIGSLPWSAPEQAEGRLDRLDTRTDVHALGVVLYHALTGRFPYNISGSTREALDAIVLAQPAPLRTRRGPRPIDGEVETIVLRCLAKSPDRRYQTAGELARDLRHYLAGEPIDAKRDSTAYVLRKHLARHRVEATAAALLLAAILAGSIVSLALWRKSERARADAVEKAAIAQAVSAFMNDDLFRAVDPRTANGRDVTVKDVLEAATARASEKLGDRPLVEAQVRLTLGEMCRRIGKFDLALTNLDRAVALREAALGLDDPATLTARFELAVAYDSEGRREEAEKLLLSVLDGRRRRLGPEDLDTLRTLNSLGIVYDGLGRYVEADRYSRAALDGYEKALGPDHIDTLRSVNNLALPLYREGRYREAERLAQRALDGFVARHGMVHVDTSYPLSTHGFTMAGLERWDAAADDQERALLARRTALGESHPDTLITMRNLGVARIGQGRLDEAAELIQTAQAGLIAAMGPGAPIVLRCTFDRARIALRRGDPRTAASLLREVLAAQRAGQQPDHPDTALTLLELCDLYLGETPPADAKPEEMIAWAGQALEIRRHAMPDSCPFVAAAQATLARAKLAAGQDAAESRRTLAAARAALAEAWGANHHAVRDCDAALSGP